MNHLETNARLALVLAGGLLAGAACQAQDAPRDCGSVTLIQRHIVARADLGMEALRSYVWTARAVHGVDMWDVKAGLDGWRATIACQREVAAAAAAAQARAEPASAGAIVAAGH